MAFRAVLVDSKSGGAIICYPRYKTVPNADGSAALVFFSLFFQPSRITADHGNGRPVLRYSGRIVDSGRPGFRLVVGPGYAIVPYAGKTGRGAARIASRAVGAGAMTDREDKPAPLSAGGMIQSVLSVICVGLGGGVKA
jgi:hypothetical protein